MAPNGPLTGRIGPGPDWGTCCIQDSAYGLKISSAVTFPACKVMRAMKLGLLGPLKGPIKGLIHAIFRIVSGLCLAKIGKNT